MQRLERAEIIGQQPVVPKKPKAPEGLGFYRYRLERLLNEREQLSQKLLAHLNKNAKFTTITVKKGQTLQSISSDLWSTTRLWPEIYLLNHEKISNWDKLTVGQKLRVWTESK